MTQNPMIDETMSIPMFASFAAREGTQGFRREYAVHARMDIRQL